MSKKIILITSAIVIISLITANYVTGVIIKNNVQKNYEKEMQEFNERADRNWQPVLLYDTYELRYEFHELKIPDNEYLTFAGFDRETINGFLASITDIHKLPVDMSQVIDEYDKVSIDAYPIIKTESLARKHRNEFPDSEPSVESFLKKSKENFDYPYSEENFDYYLTESLLNENYYMGVLDRKFYLKHNNVTVMNLATELFGVIQKDLSLTDITVNANIETDLKEIPNSHQVPRKLSREELKDVLVNGKGRIYRIENLTKDLMTSFLMQDGLLAHPAEAKITVTELSVEYFYLWEDSTLVPLLRLDGNVDTENGLQELSFWMWFIGHHDQSDTF